MVSGGALLAAGVAGVLVSLAALHFGGVSLFSDPTLASRRAVFAAWAEEDDKAAGAPKVQGKGDRGLNVPFEGPLPSSVFNATHNESLHWGTYLPHTYFGLRTRAALSVHTGAMWQSHAPGGRLRYLCEQGDGMGRYGWLRHDGRRFGVQGAEDPVNELNVTTTFVKHDQHPARRWTATVAAEPFARKKGGGKPAASSVFWYLAVEDPSAHVSLQGRRDLPAEEGGGGILVTLSGASADAGGGFTMAVRCSGALELRNATVTLKDRQHLHDLRLYAEAMHAQPRARGGEARGSAVLLEFVCRGPCVVEVAMNGAAADLDDHLKALRAAEDDFAASFRRVFPRPRHSGPAAVAFAQAALSNLLGGMGHFAGSSVIRMPDGSQRPSFSAQLFTAVPSRPFFPRGFLWDEGFHQLLVAKFDRELSKDALASWLGLLHANGWIPREQILGPVARTRVPAEFLAQHPTHANPPALLLAFERLYLEADQHDAEKLARVASSEAELAYLRLALPRLFAWFDWLERGQRGARDHTYYWRGRDVEPDQSQRLNPRTLASGLDDYPRALFPTTAERHVDLACWIARGALILESLAALAGGELAERGRAYGALGRAVQAAIPTYHWDDEAREFRDWGRHAALRTRRPEHQPREDRRRVLQVTKHAKRSEGTHQFVATGPGYLSLFPFLMKLLDRDDPRVGAAMDLIESPKHLWSPYGLRSLSAQSPFFQLWNNDQDKPYWRGPVWINANYLTVKALAHYASTPSAYSDRAAQLFLKLQRTVAASVQGQYDKRGFVFENYDEATGEGTGCHPFTGWSALAVEMYPKGGVPIVVAAPVKRS
jgi:mannosyl-oligosaccharide glucosidase